jgi:hypothetical protein
MAPVGGKSGFATIPVTYLAAVDRLHDHRQRRRVLEDFVTPSDPVAQLFK